MIKDKDILKIFDIKQDMVESFSIDTYPERTLVKVKFKKHTDCCPVCGSVNIASNGNYTKKLVSVPLNDKPCFIQTFVKRFICRDCGKSFSEKNPIAYEGTKFTIAAVFSVLKNLRHYTATYSKIAHDYGVSVQKIVDIFDMFVRVHRDPLPRILLVDEFHFSNNADYKYPTILMDFISKKIVDIVESRRDDVMISYLSGISEEERKKVEMICTDMSYTFRNQLSLFFPNATFLIDHFHLTKLVNDQLNNTRKRIMRKYSHDKKSTQYRVLKHHYRVLLKPRWKIDYETFRYVKSLGYHACENGILEYMLNIDDELKKAYYAKEEYLAFDQCDEEYCMTHDKKAELESLIKRFTDTDVEECIEVAGTFRNWKKEIINSFVWIKGRRVSNGPLEGKNNYVKKILSNANGMNNFQRARNRIMYSQNRKEDYIIPVAEHRDSIKRPGRIRGKYKKNK